MTSSRAAAHHISLSAPDVVVQVRVDGVLVADTAHARLLQEGSLPPRYYLPRADVRTDLLVPSEHTTNCPFKGDASYWTLELDSGRHDNLVWSYEAPIPAVADLAGLLCFYNERVELRVGDAEL